MRIFYITANNGDGSTRTEFYDSQACIDFLTDDTRGERFLEAYMDGDGGSWGFFDAPGGIILPYGDVGTMDTLLAEYDYE